MCNKVIDILDLIEDTVEVNAKTFGLKVLEKVAALGVDDDTMCEFEELVSTWAEKMEEDVEYLLELIGGDDECECCCGCHEEEEEHTCNCDETCTCGCQEGKPCTCTDENCNCECDCNKEE